MTSSSLSTLSAAGYRRGRHRQRGALSFEESGSRCRRPAARLGIEQHRQADGGGQRQRDRAYQAAPCALLFRQHRVATAAAAARTVLPRSRARCEARLARARSPMRHRRLL
jgi:hypothetical protein